MHQGRFESECTEFAELVSTYICMRIIAGRLNLITLSNFFQKFLCIVSSQNSSFSCRLYCIRISLCILLLLLFFYVLFQWHLKAFSSGTCLVRFLFLFPYYCCCCSCFFGLGFRMLNEFLSLRLFYSMEDFKLKNLTFLSQV